MHFDWTKIRILKHFNLSHSSEDLEHLRLNAPGGLLWTRVNISRVQWRSNGRHYMTIQLHVNMRLHLDTLFWIERMRLKDNNSHSSVECQPFIKDETSNPTATPKFASLYACSSMENVFLDVSSYRTIELFRYLNTWISWFISFLDTFPHPGSVWNQDFVERLGRNRLLNAEFLFEFVEWKALDPAINWINSSMVSG